MGSGWLKALEVRGPTAFLGFLAAALVSAGHQFKWFSLGELPALAAGIANVFAILFGVSSVPWLIHCLTHPWRAADKHLRHTDEIMRHLGTLTAEEGLFFWGLVASGRRAGFAATFPAGGFGPHGLTNRGLMRIQASVGSGHVFEIKDEVWEIVQDQADHARAAVETIRRQHPELE